MSMNVCSNHFVHGYRTSKCPTPTLYMRGYDCESKSGRPAPKIRSTENKEKKSRKRKQSDSADELQTKKVLLVDEESLLGQNIDFEYPASLSPADNDTIHKVDLATQTEYKSPEKEERMFH